MKTIVLLFSLLALVACGTMRGIPSHGGGKRFSEEQRIVAGAIRQAIAGMDLKELRGKRVRVHVTALPSTGAGNVSWGGIQNIGFNGSWSQTWDELTRRFIVNPNPGLNWQNDYRDEERDDRRNVGFNLSYKPVSNYYIQKHHTEGDVNYLRSSLVMKGHHEGFVLVDREEEAQLHLLIDALGTNRSRLDRWLWRTDELTATCELSYYARDGKSGRLLFPCRRSGADGTYEELVIPYLPLASSTAVCIEALAVEDLPVCAGLGVRTPGNGNGPPKTNGALPPEVVTALAEEAQREYLESLSQQARVLMDSGKLREAGQTIQQIRQVDPNYEDLPALQKELAEDLPK